jgi:rubrerythrin
MATLVGTQMNLMDAIIALLELEYASVELYEAIINRLENKDYIKAISKFKEDHEHHIEKLIDILENNDVKFTKGPGGKQLIDIGKVILNKLTGDDVDILRVAIPAEEDNITAYNRMLEYEDLPKKCTEAFKKGLADENKHREWLVNTTGG